MLFVFHSFKWGFLFGWIGGVVTFFCILCGMAIYQGFKDHAFCCGEPEN